MQRILVAGASGLIGGHLVAHLLQDGFYVRAVGRSPLEQWKQLHAGADNMSLDLSLKANCHRAAEGIDTVYNLAADIGGVNFIEKQKALTMLSVLINTHLLMAARDSGVKRYFYASSYAVAAAEVPTEGKALTDVIEDGHIWEKLFSEKLCKYFYEDFRLPTRIGRLQNVYGPFDVYDGGRERAPAALCRKAILAKHTGNHELEIWGDGTQIRSFLYAPDAAEGIQKLAGSNITQPVRLGSKEFLTINQLVDIVETAAGITFKRVYNTGAPRGIERKSNLDTPTEQTFGWEPKTPIAQGMKEMYHWIEKDMKKKGVI